MRKWDSTKGRITDRKILDVIYYTDKKKNGADALVVFELRAPLFPNSSGTLVGFSKYYSTTIAPAACSPVVPTPTASGAVAQPVGRSRDCIGYWLYANAMNEAMNEKSQEKC